MSAYTKKMENYYYQKLKVKGSVATHRFFLLRRDLTIFVVNAFSADIRCALPRHC